MFEDMKETGDHAQNGFTSRAVRSRDFELERKEGEHPSFCDSMPKDLGTGMEVE